MYHRDKSHTGRYRQLRSPDSFKSRCFLNDQVLRNVFANIRDTFVLYFLCVWVYKWPEFRLWFKLCARTPNSSNVTFCGGKKKKKMLDGLEIKGEITLLWMQGGQISSKPVNSRDVQHSRRLNLQPRAARDKTSWPHAALERGNRSLHHKSKNLCQLNPTTTNHLYILLPSHFSSQLAPFFDVNHRWRRI